MNAMTSTLQKLASPAFYQTSYRNYMLNYAKKYIHTGSGAPIVHAMVVVGVVGYTIGWVTIERHHMAHKRAALAKGMAMEEHGH